MNRFVAIAVCMLVGLIASGADGQNFTPPSGEYIQSTSPLPDGGTVTTIYVPGNAVSNGTRVAGGNYDAFAINAQRPVQVMAPVPAATQVPSLGVPAPVVTAPVPRWRLYRYPVIAGAPQATNVQYPPFGAYPVQIQNLPPGTYVGKGFLGQPKAYVDGQPVRNLFRFVLP